MEKTGIYFACAMALSGCSNLDGLRAHGGRVPANPPEFTAATPAKVDAAQALAMERDNLTQTIAQLRGEVEQLRVLFKLQNAPLEGERRRVGGDVYSQVTSAVTAAPAPAPPQILTPARPAVQVAQAAPTAAAAALAPVVKADRSGAPNYTALFKFGSAALDDTSRAALAALRPQLASAQKVSLKAYADTVGDASANAKLAQARAGVIEQELLKLGVPKERIEITTKVADSKPPEGATILGLFRAPDAMSRRVDLALLSSPTVQ